MTACVTSDHVATLRSYLSAAFCEAVERRFSTQDPAERVTEFVVDVRARFDRDGNHIDPLAAERMIRAVYSDEQIDDLDSTVKGRTQIILLAALIAGGRPRPRSASLMSTAGPRGRGPLVRYLGLRSLPELS